MEEQAQTEALRRELRSLRRNEGRSLTKLLASPRLRAALGDPTAGDLQDRFDAEVWALGSDTRARALRNAYAVGGSSFASTLEKRRQQFGDAQGVNRSPETIADWENERTEELLNRLLSGARSQAGHWQVAVAVERGRVVTMGEGIAESGTTQRHYVNPFTDHFWPGFIYELPSFVRATRFTLCVIFIDALPQQAFCVATADLFGVSIGDGRQPLDLRTDELPGVSARGYAAVHYDRPELGVYYGVTWRNG